MCEIYDTGGSGSLDMLDLIASLKVHDQEAQHRRCLHVCPSLIPRHPPQSG
jgi:hypothetical protein